MRAKLHIKKSEIEEAKKIYLSVLSAFPENKRAQEGLTALKKPNQKIIPQNLPEEEVKKLINFYKQGYFFDVIKLAQSFKEQYPNSIILWNILGSSAIQTGMLELANCAFQTVVYLNPAHADGFNNLGIVLKKQGKLNDAIKAYKKAIFIRPNYPEAYNNMGIALQNQSKLKEAIEAHKKAILIKPNYAEAYNYMGMALQNQRKSNEAIEAFKKAISIKPEFAEAYNNIGLELHNQGKLDKAKEAYNKAILIRPNYVDAYNNIGITLKVQGELDKAIQSYKKAISLQPNYAKAYINIGNALKEQGNLDEALFANKKGISINPNYAEAYKNSGLILIDQGKMNEAFESFNKALSIEPNLPSAHYGCSIIHNLQGNLEKGFKKYEWRLKMKELKIKPPRKTFTWDGSKSLIGKRFAVYEEQGLGDIIQFCRYLILLKQKGAEITFKVNKKMHALLKTLDEAILLVDNDPDENDIDFEIALMSLPHLLNTNLNTIPSMGSYLYADRDKIVSWSKRFKKPSFKIGICWQGSKNKIDVGRSFDLSLFKDISRLPNVELISLHKGEGENQIKDINFELTTLGSVFDSGEDAFVDTAAVMANCNLIITSDTAIAHLAGALGCPTWVILKKVPDWRWMLGRNDSPWYPKMKLFRQKKRNDWGEVFEIIKKDLLSLIKSKEN